MSSVRQCFYVLAALRDSLVPCRSEGKWRAAVQSSASPNSPNASVAGIRE